MTWFRIPRFDMRMFAFIVLDAKKLPSDANGPRLSPMAFAGTCGNDRIDMVHCRNYCNFLVRVQMRCKACEENGLVCSRKIEHAHSSLVTGTKRGFGL